MNVALVPFYKSQLKNDIFKINNSRDNVKFPYFNLKNKLLEHNIEINTVDLTSIKKADIIIFLSLDVRFLIKCFLNNKLKNSIYIQFEPPVVEPLNSSYNLKWISKIFQVILTWQDDLLDDKKFYNFYFPLPPRISSQKKIDFSEKNFITTIVGRKKSKRKNQLYSERELAIEFFQEKSKDFLFFGYGWDKSLFSSYAGQVDSKLEKLKYYKYTICYENEEKINGLISEKIFDCFYSNSIPIYLGAANISDKIPENLFIDKRKFSTYDKLYSHLLGISEIEYNEKINAIEEYLNSKDFLKFQSNNFADTILKAILNLSNNKLKFGISFFLIKLIVLKAIFKFLNYSDAK